MKLETSLPGRTWLTLALLLGTHCSVACGSWGTTRLCDDFQSYESVQGIRAQLARRGLAEGWKEESQGTSENDKRKPYKFTYLQGPFRLSGVEGQLKFTFFNGRLMETQFVPQKGSDYMEVLRRENSKVPMKAAEEIIIDRRTKLRFDVLPGGNLTFTWYDPKLDNEWKNWLASNS